MISSVKTAKHAPIKVFWLTPAELERVSLRRYSHKDLSPNDAGHSYHDARLVLRDASVIEKDLDLRQVEDNALCARPEAFPQRCACGYVFTAEDALQVFRQYLYSGAPNGQMCTLLDAPAGAMWDADWLGDCDFAKGPDGICLCVRLPNGSDWLVDQEASNCNKTQWRPTPENPKSRVWSGRTHYCWVRHGDPRTGDVHVDKGKRGESCDAGAGSILSGSYHGFLHHGHIKEA